MYQEMYQMDALYGQGGLMSKRILIVLAVLIAVAGWCYGQSVRRHLPRATQPPDAEAARVLVYASGGPEADLAAAEISQSLIQHGCQLEVHQRAQADGTWRTVVIVQAVTTHVAPLP